MLPTQAARMAVNAMLAPYGDEAGALAIRELKRMRANVEAFDEDPHDTGAHMIEYTTERGKTLRTITFRGCRSDFSRGMFLDAWQIQAFQPETFIQLLKLQTISEERTQVMLIEQCQYFPQ